MSTKRNPLTTYVDEPTLRWVQAGAHKEVRTVSQFLAALLIDAMNRKVVPAQSAYRAPVAPLSAVHPDAAPARVAVPIVRDPHVFGPLKACDWEIPAGWTNKFEKTLAEQNADYEDDELEYWPEKGNPHSTMI